MEGIPPDRSAPLARRMQKFVEDLQVTIREKLEELDARAEFREDRWMRPGGGGGITATMQDGAVFEKAGVNTSAVYGKLPDRMARGLDLGDGPFFATGISLVVHPENPYVPAVHANFRYFALGDDLEDPDDQWFGGGADLTPYYPALEDAKHFHRTWKSVCDRHEPADYHDFKRQCDEYFFLPHRAEARGVGGIFFDYIREDPEAMFAFVREAGEAFLPSYVPITERWIGTEYSNEERAFQEIRRGRYAEFNLLFDRGTKFGIETSGRTESILMSLPPRVQWRYDWQPEPGTKEARASWFFQPREWLALTPEDAPAPIAV